MINKELILSCLVIDVDDVETLVSNAQMHGPKGNIDDAVKVDVLARLMNLDSETLEKIAEENNV